MKIMIVDDEPLVRIGIKSIIQKAFQGYEIFEAENGQKAIQTIEAEHLDLVITDIRMPVMDGLSLIENTKSLNCVCTFIVLSCHADYDYVRKAMKLGAKDYILKHKINPEEIIRLIEDIEERVKSDAVNNSCNLNDIPLKSDREIIKREYLKSLFVPGYFHHDSIVNKFEDYGIRLRTTGIFLCLFEINYFNKVKENYPESDLHLLVLSVLNMSTNILSNYETGESVYLHENRFAIILNSYHSSKQKANKEILQIVNTIKKNFEDYLNLITTWAIIPDIASIDQILDCFDRASVLLEFRFYRKTGTILFEHEIAAYQFKKNTQIDLSTRNDHVKLLAETETRNIEDKVCYIFDRIKPIFQPYSKPFKKYVLLLITKIHDEIMKSHSIYNGFDVNYEEIFYKLDTLDTIQDVKEFLVDYLSNLKNLHSSHINSYHSPIVLNALSFIKSHFMENISLNDVAKFLNANPSYLSRIFKQEMSTSLVEYLTSVKIKKAKEYLCETNKSVGEIASKTGYQNQQYFSKTFKKIVGLSPLEYRAKALAEKNILKGI